MTGTIGFRNFRETSLATLCFSMAIWGLFAFFLIQCEVAAADSDPWNSAQTVKPADLVRELANNKQTPLTVLYVGFRTLYNGGHIPGSSFHGTPSTEKGLAELKSWADSLPRSTNLVLYCGCCPLERCPNIRPAFTTLQQMGFANLRVLILPTSFAADWAEKGFPVEKAH
jgi:thiosulfate/3-mercaptopyruvate sulfurtransferase